MGRSFDIIEEGKTAKEVPANHSESSKAFKLAVIYMRIPALLSLL